MSKRLTIIVPGYNTPKAWWCRCISSLLNATIPEDEIICVDDGSQVPVSEFWDEISGGDKRLRLLSLTRNSGQSVARNRALDEAAGEYITFVDSDDEVAPDVYERCISRMRDTSSDMAVFGVKVVWQDVGLCKYDMVPERDFGKIKPKDVRELYDACLLEYPVNKIYRRSFLNDHAIRFNPGVCPGEDTAFNLLCLCAKPSVVYVDCIGYVYYRMDGTSLSRSFDNLTTSLRYRTKLWQEYKKSQEGGREALGAIGEYTDHDIVLAEWRNMWQRGSSVGHAKRFRYLTHDMGLARGAALVRFAVMVLRTFMRKHMYFKWVRIAHTKKLFKNVVKVEVSE